MPHNPERKAGALNAGLRLLLPRLAPNDAVLQTDGDTVLEPQLVEALAQSLERNERVGASSCAYFAKPYRGLLSTLQQAEFAMERRRIQRRRGVPACLSGVATLFRVQCFHDIAGARGTELPGSRGDSLPSWLSHGGLRTDPGAPDAWLRVAQSGAGRGVDRRYDRLGFAMEATAPLATRYPRDAAALWPAPVHLAALARTSTDIPVDDDASAAVRPLGYGAWHRSHYVEPPLVGGHPAHIAASASGGPQSQVEQGLALWLPSLSPCGFTAFGGPWFIGTPPSRRLAEPKLHGPKRR